MQYPVVYLAGPMTGRPGLNFKAFKAASKRYTQAGFTVIDPSCNFWGRTDLPTEVYMRRDLRDILAVDLVVMLPEWGSSKNANLERRVAYAIGTPVAYDVPGIETKLFDSICGGSFAESEHTCDV